MKIGIFGGSFNPVHNMHVNISFDLIKKCYLDKVIYVPTGDMYNKKDLIKFEDRLNMLKLIVDNDKLNVSDIGNNYDYQYTYQTLDYFKNIYKFDDIYFICGTDNLKSFDTWREYEYILNNYKLLVVKRNNDDVDEILNKYSKYKDSIIITDVSSSKVSSTDIRDNIRNNIRDLNLDGEVYDYIIKNNLYK